MLARATLLAAGVLSAAMFTIPGTAEAGRITVVNNAGIVARVQWQVADSVSGWTNLALGSSTFRDYPDNYPAITVRIQHHTGLKWKDTNCNYSAVSPTRNWNFELKGTLFSFTCTAS